ncbi:MAG: AMP-binding protein [Thermodesulfobacteriota bacterium]
MKTLGELIEGLSERGATTVWMQFTADGVREFSYEELAGQSRRLANGLIDLGVSSGQPVALLAEPSFEWLTACLAAIRAGGMAMPLDVQMGEEILASILEDSDAQVVFTTEDHLEQLRSVKQADRLTVILMDSDSGDHSRLQDHLSDAEQEIPSPKPDDSAALFYTSGTTGPPKGVPLTHDNLVFQLNVILDAGIVHEGDRVLLPLPLHHVYPLVMGTFAPLAVGLTIVRPKSLTGPQVVHAIKEGGVTVVAGVPRLYKALYEGIASRFESGGRIAAGLFNGALSFCKTVLGRTGKNPGRYLFKPIHSRFGPDLRLLASGGSELKPELARNLQALGWNVAIGYGLTETSPLLTINFPESFRLGSVGRPVPGVEVRIDPSARPDDQADEAGEDENGREGRGDKEGTTDDSGEILAKGPNVFQGYLNLPEKTEDAFTEDGWYRTGDLGYLDEDGYLFLVGRRSTMLVTEGGENIQPDTIEEAYEQSPVIREAGVLQKDDNLVGLFVPDLGEIRNRGMADVEDALREAISTRSKKLPSYQRVSDYAITRKALPRTRLGKIRRHVLRDRYDEAKQEAEAGGGIQQKPLSPDEMGDEDRALLSNRAARRTWDWLAERFKDFPLSPDSSPQADLGVDSLEWLNLTMEIRQRIGVELDEEAIGRIETVRDLLREVTEAAEGGKAGPGMEALENPEEMLTEKQKRWLNPLSPTLSGIARRLFALNRFLVRSLFGLKVEGLSNLPEEGPYLLTPNHVSYLDPFAVAAALGYPRLGNTYWAGWVGVAFNNPLFRFGSRLARTVPIDPEKGVISSLAFAAAVVKRGKNMVWFPEGMRSPEGSLLPFKPGIGFLLNKYPVPVVPVAIEGTFEAMPVGRFWPRFRKITVRFGEPVDIADLKEEKGEGNDTHTRIADELRAQVSGLLRR